MPADSYWLGAQSYDLMHGREHSDRMRSALSRFARRARSGILDVGTGTGISGFVLVEASDSDVPVVLVEPSPSMRIALLTKLAGRPDLHARVTVVARDLLTFETQHLGISFDLAVCVWVVQAIPPTQRPVFWNRIAHALVPEATLVVDTWPQRSWTDQPEQEGPPVALGRYTYHTAYSRTIVDDQRALIRASLRTRHAGRIIDEASVIYDQYHLNTSTLADELTNAGFAQSTRLPGADEDLGITIWHRQ